MIKVLQEIDLYSTKDMESILTGRAFLNWDSLSESEIAKLEKYLNERYFDEEGISITDLDDLISYDLDYILNEEDDLDVSEEELEDPENSDEEE